jgi:hypothetical protein
LLPCNGQARWYYLRIAAKIIYDNHSKIKIDIVPKSSRRFDAPSSQGWYILLNQGTKNQPVNATVIALLISMFNGKLRCPRVDLLITIKSITDG